MARKPKKTEIAEAAPSAPAVIKAVKGFDRDLKCRGFQFEVGKTYSVEGKVVVCQNGWHACENPLDVFRYYSAGVSRFHEVEQTGDLARHAEDTKIASATITIGVELSISEIVSRAVKWIFDKATVEKESTATSGDRANAATSGKSSVAGALGRNSKAKAGEGGAICLVCRDDDGSILAIRASKVGENNVKADIWYSLNASGEFVEEAE